MKPLPQVGNRPVLILSLLFCLGTLVCAQERFEIKGKIIDRDTKEPIVFCAVALSGTSLGSITDEQGRYIISDVPKQPYKLIASHIGYYNKVLDVNPDYPRPSYNMSLKIKVTDLESVAIESRGRGKVGRLKRRNLDRFKRLIFGETYNANLIEITNEEILDLKDKMNSVIASKKTYDLQISNQYLGYDISYLNLNFSLSDAGKTFLGYPTFSPMKAENSEQETNWMKNRADAYRGSLKHFFISLISNSIDDDLFVANLTNDDPSQRRQSTFQKKTEQVRTKATKRTKPNVIIKLNEEKGIYEVSFKGVIELFYLEDDGSSSHSFLKMKSDKVEVYPSGVLKNPLSIVVYGDLANQGVYYMLPSNYHPQR